ncbi:MAG: chorismate synthase [Bacillota bacterium]|nr:MAG: chorismate synthase [Bacillota bacterium]
MPPRLLTAGESHGPALVVVVDGLPAGIPFGEEALAGELARRQAGHGRGPRASRTCEQARIVGGVSGGFTTGAPVAVELANPDPGPGTGPTTPADPVPRPGHADLALAVKYGSVDFRPHAERASARETAARVAGGALAKAFLGCLGVSVGSHVTAIGGVGVPGWDSSRAAGLDAGGWREILKAAETSLVRCADHGAGERMATAIDAARVRGDTLGGVFEVIALGCPAGIGAPGQWDTRLDTRLAGAVMSVPGVKAVAIGLGFDAAALPGAEAHDAIVPGDGPLGTARSSNRAGGVEGGMTNGQPVVVRAAMKPIPTLAKPLPSVDLSTGQACPASKVRGDTCAVPAAGVVAETMVAWVLAVSVVEAFGGDTVDAVGRRLAGSPGGGAS